MSQHIRKPIDYTFLENPLKSEPASLTAHLPSTGDSIFTPDPGIPLRVGAQGSHTGAHTLVFPELDGKGIMSKKQSKAVCRLLVMVETTPMQV